jgi:hypothetical protein
MIIVALRLITALGDSSSPPECSVKALLERSFREKANKFGTLFEGRRDGLHEESMRIHLDGLFVRIKKKLKQIPNLSMRGSSD